jgi:hypothetical protein
LGGLGSKKRGLGVGRALQRLKLDLNLILITICNHRNHFLCGGTISGTYAHIHTHSIA